ncbi:MAG: hypothetical protein RIF32_15800 [Leptospirales bacterium]|jgi:hypothetical protein
MSRSAFISIISPVAGLSVLLAGLFLAQCGGGGGQGREGQISRGDCKSGRIATTGEAPIFASISASRDKAKEDACRQAVEKCIGEEIASETGVADGQSIANEVFTKARGICKNDQILDEEQYLLDTTKMLRISVRFDVKQVDIRDTIDTMRELAGNPKLMILIREEYNLPPKRVEGFTSRNAKAASLLRDFFINKGYTVLDPGAVTRGLNEADLAANPGDIPDALKDRAADAGADVLIIGRIEVLPQNISALRGSDFKSYRAEGNITMLALWGYGNVLGEFSESQPGAHVNQLSAARAAVESFTRGRDERKPAGLANFAFKRLENEWGSITRNNKIKLSIAGIDEKEAGVFRDNLQEATAVKRVNPISFDSNGVVWDLTYPGRSFALADTLGFYGDNPQMFSALRFNCKTMKVENVKRGEINLRFVGGGC